MNMQFNILQQQQQKLIMTPELKQAISILQLSSLDLMNQIKEIAIENPLIDIETPSSLELQSNISYSSYNSPTSTHEKNDYIIDNYKLEINLQEALLKQIGYLTVGQEVYKVLVYLIYSLDDRGYVTQSIEEIAAEMNTSSEIVKEALSIIQNLEPIGVGAFNLQDCILIQLRHLDKHNHLAETIIQDDFDLFLNKKWSILSKKYQISLDKIQEVADTIQKLNFRPASNFSMEQTKYINPDLILEFIEDKYFITVNDYILPNIQLNPYYKSLLKSPDHSTSEYIKEKYEELKWISKSIEQRKQTLYNVADVIVSIQKEFFINEAKELKPLTLKDIANKLNIHESTVSRATNQKYIQTPKGLFELKYFLKNGLSVQDGETISSHSVKEKIKTIINSENKKTPYSDQQIADQLTANGIQVSRRTVAKYREEMEILSSQKRKRY